jgi:acyl carrier protein
MASEAGDKKELIRSVIGRVLNIEPALIGDHALLGSDLPADSLTLLEIALSLERHFQITIPDSDYPKLNSLERIFERVKELELEKRGSAPVH